MANWKKMNDAVSNEEFREARRFESARITTISQAVKAFARDDAETIREWRKKLAEIESGQREQAQREESK